MVLWIEKVRLLAFVLRTISILSYQINETSRSQLQLYVDGHDMLVFSKQKMPSVSTKNPVKAVQFGMRALRYRKGTEDYGLQWRTKSYTLVRQLVRQSRKSQKSRCTCLDTALSACVLEVRKTGAGCTLYGRTATNAPWRISRNVGMLSKEILKPQMKMLEKRKTIKDLD